MIFTREVRSGSVDSEEIKEDSGNKNHVVNEDVHQNREIIKDEPLLQQQKTIQIDNPQGIPMMTNFGGFPMVIPQMFPYQNMGQPWTPSIYTFPCFL